MKTRSIFILILVVTATITLAIGPKIPHLLTYTPSPSAGVTGYWVYWRASTGTYSDSQRAGISTNVTVFDLSSFGLPKGIYYVTMSATNATSESDLAVEVMWNYQNPNKPSDLVITP